jgi:hypothetical protein
LSFKFAQWLSTTVLVYEYVLGIHLIVQSDTYLIIRAPVQHLLMAYTVDLICVLRELFIISIKPGSRLTTTWPDIREAFETYLLCPSRQHIHRGIYSYTSQNGWSLTAYDIGKKLHELLDK